MNKKNDHNHNIGIKLPNDLASRTMAFFWMILAALGFNQASFAAAVGISQQLIYHYLQKKDDCLLATVQHLLRKIGIILTPFFKRRSKDSSTPTSSTTCSSSSMMRGRGFTITGLSPKVMPSPTPAYIQTYVNRGGGRLSFLADAILESGLSEKELCSRTGLKRGVLRHIFESNDITISYLQHIADALNCEIVWQISETDDPVFDREAMARDYLISAFDQIEILSEKHSKGNIYYYHIRFEGNIRKCADPHLSIISVEKKEAYVRIRF